MAHYTAIASGDWDQLATWDLGTGTPGIGDTFQIDVFTVTIPAALNVTVGAGTLTGTGTGTRAELIINGSLTLQGALTLNNYNTLSLGAGAILDINGNNIVYTATSTDRNRLYAVGAPTNRCKIKSTATGGDIRRAGLDVACSLTIQYADVTDVGVVNIGSNFNAGDFVRVQDASFTGCGELTIGGWRHIDGDYIVRRCDFRETASLTANMAIFACNDSNATGAGVIDTKHNTFSNTANGKFCRTDGYHLDFDGSVFSNVATEFVLKHPVLAGNCLYHVNGASGSGIGTMSTDVIDGSYLVLENDNPHANTIYDISNCVIEVTYGNGYTDDGDHFIIPTTATTCTVEYNLILEERSGVFMNALGGARTGTYELNHNTLVGNYDQFYGSLARTESGGSFAGVFNAQSNLIYDKSVIAGSLGFNIDTAGDDQVTLMDFNNWFNIENPYQGVTSATKTPGVTAGYGGNDTTLDPQFLDDTRNLSTWDAAHGSGTGTVAAAVAHMLKINGYDSATKSQVVGDIVADTPADIVAWVRAGYAPTNQALENAGHDSITVGAIEYATILSALLLLSNYGGL